MQLQNRCNENENYPWGNGNIKYERVSFIFDDVSNRMI